MSTNFITQQQVDRWFDDLESTLKDQVVNSPLGSKQAREDIYNLYQAAQLLRARFYEDFSSVVEMPKNHEYDPD